jgi:hypothetical protein
MKKLWWCSPKNANLDKAEIDVKESEIESFYTSRGMVLCIVIYAERDRISSQQEETHFLSPGRFSTAWATNILVAGTVAV